MSFDIEEFDGTFKPTYGIKLLQSVDFNVDDDIKNLEDKIATKKWIFDKNDLESLRAYGIEATPDYISELNKKRIESLKDIKKYSTDRQTEIWGISLNDQKVYLIKRLDAALRDTPKIISKGVVYLLGIDYTKSNKKWSVYLKSILENPENYKNLTTFLYNIKTVRNALILKDLNKNKKSLFFGDDKESLHINVIGRLYCFHLMPITVLKPKIGPKGGRTKKNIVLKLTSVPQSVIINPKNNLDGYDDTIILKINPHTDPFFENFLCRFFLKMLRELKYAVSLVDKTDSITTLFSIIDKHLEMLNIGTRFISKKAYFDLFFGNDSYDKVISDFREYYSISNNFFLDKELWQNVEYFLQKFNSDITDLEKVLESLFRYSNEKVYKENDGLMKIEIFKFTVLLSNTCSKYKSLYLQDTELSKMIPLYTIVKIRSDTRSYKVDSTGIYIKMVIGKYKDEFDFLHDISDGAYNFFNLPWTIIDIFYCSYYYPIILKKHADDLINLNELVTKYYENPEIQLIPPNEKLNYNFYSFYYTEKYFRNQKLREIKKKIIDYNKNNVRDVIDGKKNPIDNLEEYGRLVEIMEEKKRRYNEDYLTKSFYGFQDIETYDAYNVIIEDKIVVSPKNDRSEDIFDLFYFNSNVKIDGKDEVIKNYLNAEVNSSKLVDVLILLEVEAKVIEIILKPGLIDSQLDRMFNNLTNLNSKKNFHDIDIEINNYFLNCFVTGNKELRQDIDFDSLDFTEAIKNNMLKNKSTRISMNFSTGFTDGSIKEIEGDDDDFEKKKFELIIQNYTKFLRVDIKIFGYCVRTEEYFDLDKNFHGSARWHSKHPEVFFKKMGLKNDKDEIIKQIKKIERIIEKSTTEEIKVEMNKKLINLKEKLKNSNSKEYFINGNNIKDYVFNPKDKTQVEVWKLKKNNINPNFYSGIINKNVSGFKEDVYACCGNSLDSLGCYIGRHSIDNVFPDFFNEDRIDDYFPKENRRPLNYQFIKNDLMKGSYYIYSTVARNGDPNDLIMNEKDRVKKLALMTYFNAFNGGELRANFNFYSNEKEYITILDDLIKENYLEGQNDQIISDFFFQFDEGIYQINNPDLNTIWKFNYSVARTLESPNIPKYKFDDDYLNLIKEVNTSYKKTAKVLTISQPLSYYLEEIKKEEIKKNLSDFRRKKKKRLEKSPF